MDTIQEGKSWWKIPVMMGVLIAAVKIICSTIQFNYLLEDFKASYIIFFISLGLGIIVILASGLMLKKQLGEAAILKNVFRGVFLTILIGVFLSYTFEQVWMLADSSIADKIFAGQKNYLKSYPNGEQQLAKLEKQHLDAKNAPFSFVNFFTGLMVDIVRYSILGFIFALAISRKKQVQ
ncbi:hypothetical protein CAP35_04155 [Chitinophagaceae bacterium IBVUCB1]|nr:hypothetical protein CAP35_04155 [Chitinophagaceae bacterium IBVUCB1]